MALEQPFPSDFMARKRDLPRHLGCTAVVLPYTNLTIDTKIFDKGLLLHAVESKGHLGETPAYRHTDGRRFVLAESAPEARL